MSDEPEIIETDDGTNTSGDDTLSELTPVELVAKDIGWKPKHEFQGPEDKWRPADEYIRQSKNIEGTLKDSIKELKGTVERLVASGHKQTERALQEQAAKYQQMLDQAVEDGDRDAAREAAKELRNTEKEIERVAKADNPEERFAKDNPWYGKDDDATAYAISISQREAAKGASVDEQLKAAAAGVRKRFPEIFEEQPQRPTLTAKPPAVNAPSSRSASLRRGTGFADLPADAKAAADSYAELFFRKGLVKSKEEARAQYAKDYFDNIQAA